MMSGMRKTGVPPAQYRLNRRAAFIAGGVFLLFGLGAYLVCMQRLDPKRRLAVLRESARSFAERKEWRQASLQLANVVQLEPSAESWFQLGATQMKAAAERDPSADGRRDGLRSAVGCLRKAVELDPRHKTARAWLLEIDLRAGNWHEVRDHVLWMRNGEAADPLVAVASELLPSADPERIAKAKLFLERGEAAQAASLLLPWWREMPDDFEALSLLVAAETRAGGVKGAESLVNEVRGLFGRNSAVACWVQAERDIAAGLLTTAEPFAASACERAGGAVRGRRALATIAERRAELDPAVAVVHYDRAVAEYRAILALGVADAGAANNAAWLLGFKLGRWDEAREITAAALAETENPSPDLLDTHGAMLLQAGRPAEAIPFFERAAITGHDPQSLLRLAKAYAGAGDAAAGAKVLRDLAARSEVNLHEVRQLLARVERTANR
ncbi:MAG TPA: tetratricopeptide repeat protein [Planctomycetia bacterium]|nr:tetratricopeptide repeat protein [Planctomycetia bacterium]